MRLASLTLIFVAVLHSNCLAGFPYNPANPRPDLFSRSLINSIDSYRRIYNRPRYLGGKVAAIIEPTSQEAMSWHDNNRAGIYGTGRATCVNGYYFAKPWEQLQSGPRPRNKIGALSRPDSILDAEPSSRRESVREIVIPQPSVNSRGATASPYPELLLDRATTKSNEGQPSSPITIGPQAH